MVENIVTALTSILGALGDFLTPTGDNSSSAVITIAGAAGVATLFAVPVAIAAGRKAIGLVKSIRG